jgi:glycosyltransferase involved in cell wall biosynthesis
MPEQIQRLADFSETENAPQMPDIGVLALVPDAWGSWWQPRHHILTRLARYFQVIWVNPASEWRSMFLKSEVQNANGSATVYDTAWLPRLYKPAWLGSHIFNARLMCARNLLISRGCRKVILYIWRPEFGPVLDSIRSDLSCYHIDDEYSFSDNDLKLDVVEKALITKVDQVFIHSLGLMERKGYLNCYTTFTPNGVNFADYATPAPEPEDLSAIPRPRIGYTGYIKKQLDWPLILDLTRQHREWSFVFVGPRSPHPEIIPALEELSRERNVHFLDAKSVQQLAAYPQHFDACIMPYRVDAYTNNIYPMKLHECLASGRPVISSPIRSVRDFSGVVTSANGPDEWSRAISDALGERANCSDRVAERQNIARGFDWDKVVYLIAQTFCERLGSKPPRQFHEIASKDCGQGHTLRR